MAPLAGVPLLRVGIWSWGFLLGLGRFLCPQALGVSASPVLSSPQHGGTPMPPAPAPGARPCSPQPVPVSTAQG